MSEAAQTRRKKRPRVVEEGPSEPLTPPSKLPPRALAAGATLLALGLAIVGVGPSDVGMGVTLAGLVVTAYGVHAFGRLGPDEGSVSI